MLDIVERLRACIRLQPSLTTGGVIEEGAREIESLRARAEKAEAERDGLIIALENLHAMVWGECPLLLEDNHHDQMCIDALEPSRLRAALKEQDNG